MKKPIIILSPQQLPMEEPFRESYNYSNNFNFSALKGAGAVPLMPSFVEAAEAEALMSRADGLFLTGGEDVSPSLYGEAALPCCGKCNIGRDRSDWALLSAALKLKKPVLCLCRGMQLANVYFGGSLYQDIDSQLKSSIRHSLYLDYQKPSAHEILIEAGTALSVLTGKKSIFVNSLHHQAVKELGSGLVPMAYSPDGIIESICLCSDTQWLRAYQWHPEMLEDDKYAALIFKDFVSACSK